MGNVMVQDLADFLISQGVCQGRAGNLPQGVTDPDTFLDNRPPTPGKALTIIDTGGFPPIGGLEDLRRTAQLMFRMKGTAEAKAWAWTAYRLLSPAGGLGFTVNGKKYITVAAQPPYPLGEDDNNRHRFVFNLVVTATPDD